VLLQFVRRRPGPLLNPGTSQCNAYLYCWLTILLFECMIRRNSLHLLGTTRHCRTCLFSAEFWYDAIDNVDPVEKIYNCMNIPTMTVWYTLFTCISIYMHYVCMRVYTCQLVYYKTRVPDVAEIADCTAQEILGVGSLKAQSQCGGWKLFHVFPLVSDSDGRQLCSANTSTCKDKEPWTRNYFSNRSFSVASPCRPVECPFANTLADCQFWLLQATFKDSLI